MKDDKTALRGCFEPKYVFLRYYVAGLQRMLTCSVLCTLCLTSLIDNKAQLQNCLDTLDTYEAHRLMYLHSSLVLPIIGVGKKIWLSFSRLRLLKTTLPLAFTLDQPTYISREGPKLTTD